MPTEEPTLLQQLEQERCINCALHNLLDKKLVEVTEWQSKYLALLSHVKGPAIDDDTSPLGGE